MEPITPQAIPGKTHHFGAAQYALENQRINQVLKRSRPAIAVHRGTAGGSISDNTADAVTLALRQGADLIEIDVIMSTDGDFYCFHDGQEPRHFGLQKNIRTMSTAEIERLNYSWARETNYGLLKLGDLLQGFPNTILNLDRSWFFWSALLPYLDAHAAVESILLKAPRGDHLQVLAGHKVHYPFMPICYSTEDVEQVRKLAAESELNLVGIELIARDSHSPFVTSAYITGLHEGRLFALANALNLPDRKPLFADMDDEESILRDPARGWGQMAELGIDVIHTDWPLLLLQYLQQAGYRDPNA